MEQVKGKCIAGGIVIGTLTLYHPQKESVEFIQIEDPACELKRYAGAKELAHYQLRRLYTTASREAGEKAARIFRAHEMILDDEELNEYISRLIIENNVNAEYAIHKAQEHFVDIFEKIEEDTIRERKNDIVDATERMIEALSRKADDKKEYPVIIAAQELTPSEVLKLEKGKVLGLIVNKGSVNSHSALLSRMMNIPTVYQINPKPEWENKLVIIDGDKGIVYIEPDVEIIKHYLELLHQEKAQEQELKQHLEKGCVTVYGKKIDICANIGHVSDLRRMEETGAEGIGLFRSEFLFLESNSYPDEEKQFEIYKTIALQSQKDSAVIRTIDLGADKQAAYMKLEPEENPAMGYRAIRICLQEQDLFKTQLRAILRASIYGNLSVMYPMITSTEEVEEIKTIVEDVKRELKSEGKAYQDIKQGIMIETPAAVMMSFELAKMVDFFSIGTNDLTQFTLAIDRSNRKLEEYGSRHPEAILKMIEIVIQNAHKAGIRVSICGEMAYDLTLLPKLLQMGPDALSVPPHVIFRLRQAISTTMF